VVDLRCNSKQSFEYAQTLSEIIFGNMSNVGKNIRKLRTVKKLSQAAFAELFGLARPSVGAYEEGRSEPKMETLIQIAQHFGLSVDLLLTKELTVNELYGFDIFKEQLQPPRPTPEEIAEADRQQNVTPLVYRNRALEYIVKHHDPAFIDSLPWLQLPHRAHRAPRGPSKYRAPTCCCTARACATRTLCCAAASTKPSPP
jgi:transcriptional regulator with XRE-family HTH domain